MPYGAAPEDWAHFDLVLGLTADLLPVVSDPNAEISAQSTLKKVGKVPSIYNQEGKAAGLKSWTDRVTKPSHIRAWSQDERLGICIQTRHWRALDIDVPDMELGNAIACRIAELLPDLVLPLRFREGTGKALIPIRLEGTWAKRVMKVEGGMIEFLANGQQFVAVGTHPDDGTRYQWVGGLPDEAPLLGEHAFERLWRVLTKEFAIEPPVEFAVGLGQKGVDLNLKDDIAEWLQANWPVFGASRDGARLFCLCPWKDGHSMDSGETEAAWLPAGTNGVERGHFKCLHASCGGRTDEEFLTAVGYTDSLFEDESQAVAELYAEKAKQTAARTGKEVVLSTGRLPLPGFVRDKDGAIEAVIENVSKAVAHVDACGVHLRYDSFVDDLLIRPREGAAWRVFEDADAVDLRIALAGIGFKPVGRELMRDALVKVSKDNRFDSAIDWLEHLPPWDGVSRVSGFLHTYFKVEDRPYHTAVSRYIWTGLAARVMEPGCQLDMVPAFVGEQGLLKTSAIMAIAPWQEAFTEFDFADDKTELARLMRGTLVGELAELQGLQTRAQEGIKAWITKRQEKWTKKYVERGTSFNRRCMLFGSSNILGFLSDPTGERRWLPVTVIEQADGPGIVADREQLWAEGLALWKEKGLAWREAERLAKLEHSTYRDQDEWEGAVRKWLDSDIDLTGDTPLTKGYVTSREVAEEALGITLRSFGKTEQRRVGKILHACGLKGQTVRTPDGPAWGYTPPNGKV
jgi:predicted P-loop ATPase